jgi:glycosidase
MKIGVTRSLSLIAVSLAAFACGDDTSPAGPTGGVTTTTGSTSSGGGNGGQGGAGGQGGVGGMGGVSEVGLADTDWPEAMLYFIFVDRFANGDPTNDAPIGPPVDLEADWRGGDWAGITQKIEENYFTDLGVNTLWLSVPMDNPQVGHADDQMVHTYSGYHSYWPENFDLPEEHFGTLAELQALVTAAHGKGMKVILDYAMNHAYITSPTYVQNPDWFWPLDQDYGGQTKTCLCGKQCSWDEPTERKRCWFTPYLPDFNFTNPDARLFSVDNAIKWINDTGIDGYRLDALKHIEDAWITDFRDRLEVDIEPASGKHFYTVGETFTGDKELLKYYVNPGTMLDGQFDFPLRASIVATVLRRSRNENGMANPTSMKDLDTFLVENEGFYGAGLMSNFLGNHDIVRTVHHAEDTPRWDNEWSGDGGQGWTSPPPLPAGTSAFERLANAYTILFTIRGIPLIYYGDEIGMAGGGDPDNRRLMEFDAADYTAGQVLLLDHVKKLTRIRADHEALRRGVRATLSVTDDTIAYQMTQGSETIYVLVNRGDAPATLTGLPDGAYTNLLTASAVEGPSPMLGARTSMILVKN